MHMRACEEYRNAALRLAGAGLSRRAARLHDRPQKPGELLDYCLAD